MIELPPYQFACPGFFVREAVAPWKRAGAAALRARVFVHEQALFHDHDRDGIDDMAITLAALSTYAHEADWVVGAVHLHSPAPGVWWRSRLAVDGRFRKVAALGTALIRLAVGTARAHGCETFLAHVQARNVPLFERLGWEQEARITLHAAPHALMRARMEMFPPLADPAAGCLALTRHAA
jgi:putative N-acetyltransferase (TIGR04045 family)